MNLDLCLCSLPGFIMPVFRVSYLYLLPAFIRPMFNISLICYILPAFIMPFTSLASSPVFIVTSFISCVALVALLFSQCSHL